MDRQSTLTEGKKKSLEELLREGERFGKYAPSENRGPLQLQEEPVREPEKREPSSLFSTFSEYPDISSREHKASHQELLIPQENAAQKETSSLEELLRKAEQNLLYMDILRENSSVSPLRPESGQEKIYRPSTLETNLPSEAPCTIPSYQSEISQEVQERTAEQKQMSELIEHLLAKAQGLSEKLSAVSTGSDFPQNTEEIVEKSTASTPDAQIPELTSILEEWLPASAAEKEKTGLTQEDSTSLPASQNEIPVSEDKGASDKPSLSPPPFLPFEPGEEEALVLPSVQEPAKKRRKRREKDRKKKSRSLIACLLSFTVFCAAIAIALQFYGVAIVQGTSMSPSLDEKDLVLFSRNERNFQRGDIVILRYEQELIVKRIVGVPGDLIEVDQDGYVLLNGERLKGEPALYGRANINGDVSFPVQVTEGHYFLLGDNRPVSLDSRMSAIGQVSQDDVVGEVISWIHIE